VRHGYLSLFHASAARVGISHIHGSMADRDSLVLLNDECSTNIHQLVFILSLIHPFLVMVHRTHLRRCRSNTMDRSRAAQGSPGPSSVAMMHSPRVIRTARMSAPESFSLLDFPRASSPNGMPPLMARTAVAATEWSDTSSSLADSDSSLDVSSDRPTASVARRSTRKRKAPELLEPSAETHDYKPRKRKANTPEPKKPPAKKRAPGRLKTDPDEKPAECDSNCCICMTEPETEELAKINGCDHYFCFECIEKWADRENTCPLCKKRFVKIERVHKPKRQKGVQTPKNTVKVKNKSQRSELTSSLALEGLFGELRGSGIAFESFFGELLLCGVL